MRVLQLRQKIGSLLLITFTVFLVTGSNLVTTAALQEDGPDYWPTVDWRSATPESKGMNSSRLNEMMSIVIDEDMPLHSLLIVKDGYMVMEEYPRSAFSSNTTHLLYSCTKSITSVMVGIAMNQGFIDNVSQKVLDFFPDRAFENVDSRKENMSLEDLLTMRSGIEWDEWSVPYGDGSNDYIQMMTSSDPISFILDRPMMSEPGTDWVYSGGASHLLSAIVQVTTGKTTLQLAQESLFDTIGIPRAYWDDDALGINIGGSELALRPQDMARIGYLYLNNGTWDGQEVVSSEWVKESTNTRLMLSNYSGYGYQWWTYPNIGAYYATGLYGQRITVIPQHNLVVVFTGGFVNQGSPYYEFLTDYIIPAAEDAVSLSSTSIDSMTVPIVAGAILVPVIIAIFVARRRN